MKLDSIIFNEVESFIVKDFLQGDLLCMNDGEEMSWTWSLKDYGTSFFLFGIPNVSDKTLKEQTLYFISNGAIKTDILTSIEIHIEMLKCLDNEDDLDEYQEAYQKIIESDSFQ